MCGVRRKRWRMPKGFVGLSWNILSSRGSEKEPMDLDVREQAKRKKKN